MSEVLSVKIERGTVDDEAGTLPDASPYGITIKPTFMIDDYNEIVRRYSYLNTDYRGTQICAVVPGAENTFAELADNEDLQAGDLYNNITSAYVDYDAYMANLPIKISAGYEFVHFKERLRNGDTKDDFISHTTDLHVFCARVQLMI